MICFLRNGGIAHDIRFVPDDYVPQGGELTRAGDVLPSAQSLSDPAAWQVMADAESAVATRNTAIDSSIAVNTIGIVQPASVAQLKAMTVAEYSAWFDTNFDTAAKLIALLKRLVLIIIRRVL